MTKVSQSFSLLSRNHIVEISRVRGLGKKKGGELDLLFDGWAVFVFAYEGSEYARPVLRERGGGPGTRGPNRGL